MNNRATSARNDTSENHADDALAGLEYLKGRKEIDPTRIGLIGHSEGGMIAQIAAVKSADVAFVVLLAAPGILGEELFYAQEALIDKAYGASDESITRKRAVMESVYAVLKQEKDDPAARKRLGEIYVGLKDADKRAIGLSPSAVEVQIERLLWPHYRYLLTYNPRANLSSLKCPVLALNGDHDLQVPPDENLGAIEAALKLGGNKDYQVMKLAGLNHLFQTCITGVPSEYLTIEETIAPVALKAVGDWLLQHTVGKGAN